jgi:hypothetical protein
VPVPFFYSNDPSGCNRRFLDQLRDYQLLKHGVIWPVNVMRPENLTTPCFAVIQLQHLVVYSEDERNIFLRRVTTCQITLQYEVQYRFNLPLVDRDGSVGIATRYGLDGPVIKSIPVGGGRDFPSRPALVPTQPPIQWVPGPYRGKAAGVWR